MSFNIPFMPLSKLTGGKIQPLSVRPASLTFADKKFPLLWMISNPNRATQKPIFIIKDTPSISFIYSIVNLQCTKPDGLDPFEQNFSTPEPAIGELILKLGTNFLWRF